MPALTDKFDAIITDPPYVYIKKLEWDKAGFDKEYFSDCVVNVLAKNSMIAMFGRGTFFYRINCLFEDAGLTFKEEIIWNKRQGTSPCMPLHRVHETISIFSKGNAKILKAKIPYLEKKQYDIKSICQDVRRISSALKNPKELSEMLSFLEQNGKVNIYTNGKTHKHKISQQDAKSAPRGVATMAMIKNGMSESSILRTDMQLRHTEKHGIVTSNDIKDGYRSINTLQSMTFGMNESSIFEENREHYKMEHPTQKPVRLFERLLNIISQHNSIILDPFAGSGTTGIACMNTSRRCVLIEKEEKYAEIAARRLQSHQPTLGMNLDE